MPAGLESPGAGALTLELASGDQGSSSACEGRRMRAEPRGGGCRLSTGWGWGMEQEAALIIFPALVIQPPILLLF